MQMYMSKPRLGVVTAAWANRPSPSVVGALFFATDIGSGVLFRATGSVWAPVGQGYAGGSAVAVSHTGDTNETTLATVSIPASAMGTNGGLLIYSTWSFTNSANTKTFRTRLGGISGTAFLQANATANATFSDIRRIRNRNSASSQVSATNAGATGIGLTTAAVTTGSIDTAVAQDLVFTAQLALGTETITLENYEVWLLP